ncbi:unnamed protein product [Tilletia laevis]|uniref:Uncharacterized protein n=1 Tax=Tilletia laevis TaxID=157183 RepID=A0A9N8QBF8_9BASI|nr:unnamed protein product [Tilletia caries]CAD6922039.1 unnamed protein product [Tilletia laevis]
MKEKKDAKDQTDRRTKRRKARRESRHKVARGGSDRISGAMADMVVLPCIEADESGMEEGLDDVSDDDLGLDDIAPGKRTKTLRPIIPEWWSKENKDLQHKLARRAPASNIKCRVLEATHLTLHQDPLPAEVPRIAVSSTFAERYPHLVLDVKENSPPFKPERGAVAESAGSWGSPIADLVLLGEANSGTGGGGEDELGGGGAEEDSDEVEVDDEDEDDDDGMDMS